MYKFKLQFKLINWFFYNLKLIVWIENDEVEVINAHGSG